MRIWKRNDGEHTARFSDRHRERVPKEWIFVIIFNTNPFMTTRLD